MNTNELLEQLRQPFPPDAISWLPGSTTKDGSKCMAMAYADLRAYQERLDEVCGLDWSCRYIFWGDRRIACELTIGGVTRSSTGEYDAQDEKSNIAGTVAEAQSFKRAAAMFGLGRYLYELPAAWVGFDSAAKKISKDGQAELDNRYKVWYQKTTAVAKRSVPVERKVDTDTGEIVQPPPDNPFEDVEFPNKAERILASQSKLNHMHALGMEYYRTQENWNKKRPEWVRDASADAVKSSKELSPEQVDWIIEKLQGRINKRAQVDAQEAIAVVA